METTGKNGRKQEEYSRTRTNQTRTNVETKKKSL